MKKVITKVITILLIILMLTGCGTSVRDTQKSENVSRFMIVEGTWSDDWIILADYETGVMYTVSNGAYNRGTFTLLVDREGKPLIWEGE